MIILIASHMSDQDVPDNWEDFADLEPTKPKQQKSPVVPIRQPIHTVRQFMPLKGSMPETFCPNVLSISPHLHTNFGQKQHFRIVGMSELYDNAFVIQIGKCMLHDKFGSPRQFWRLKDITGEQTLFETLGMLSKFMPTTMKVGHCARQQNKIKWKAICIPIKCTAVVTYGQEKFEYSTPFAMSGRTLSSISVNAIKGKVIIYWSFGCCIIKNEEHNASTLYAWEQSNGDQTYVDQQLRAAAGGAPPPPKPPLRRVPPKPGTAHAGGDPQPTGYSAGDAPLRGGSGGGGASTYAVPSIELPSDDDAYR